MSLLQKNLESKYKTCRAWTREMGGRGGRGRWGRRKDSPRSLQNVLLDICLSPEPTVDIFSLVQRDQDLIFFKIFAPIYLIYPSPFTFFPVQRLSNSEIATSLTNNRKKDHKQKLSISSPFCLHISSVQVFCSSEEINTPLAQLRWLMR